MGLGEHPAASGWLPSCKRSWEQLCKPCPASGHQLSLSRGNGVFAEPPGCSCTPSPSRAPMGVPELGRAWGRQSLGQCLSQPGISSPWVVG